MHGRGPKLLDGPELLNYALRTLSARALSAGEMKVRLSRRAAERADIDEVISKLRDSGFLDDARFAEGYATSRRDNQGFGQMRVLRDLRARRVAGSVAGDAVRDAFEGIDETEMVEQYLARKYRAVSLPEFLKVEKNLASAFRRLRSAGFSSSIAIRVLKRYAARADELEDEPPGAEE